MKPIGKLSKGSLKPQLLGTDEAKKESLATSEAIKELKNLEQIIQDHEPGQLGDWSAEQRTLRALRIDTQQTDLQLSDEKEGS